jgi:hypothetical protein
MYMWFPCQGFVCEGVVDEDVVKLLEKAIQRHPDMDIEVKNTCFLNIDIFLTGPDITGIFVGMRFFSLMVYVGRT